ncbi:uncharacterized protein N7498_003301 [Penicillium cinerascens]|uniref:Alpha-galactosidase A n=1 Tax=Penicillium cinerascens TaxID=70096 RepID=A0A9W9T7Q8_9EURO|nr:uncharacterized protein N7498_003301 [Penicillium cinerascens]KAJ5211655.1 hypothetical protein N7498_003301 [Penicillium cinerascens]
MANTYTKIQLLQASVDPDNEMESEFRVLVDGQFVKYITIDPGLYDPDDMCFPPAFASLLPQFPDGDWNEGRISRDPTTGTPHLVTSKVDLPGIPDIWHPAQVDHLELHVENQLRSNVLEVACDRFDSVVIAKFARFPWELPRLEAESAVYKWLEGHGIGPAFLGHLTEEGRVIGFIMARITHSRHPTPGDIDVCRLALLKLHKLGIKHGDINKHNFLLHNGNVTLVDFDSATRVTSQEELDEELHSLDSQLRDTSGLGGVIMEELR